LPLGAAAPDVLVSDLGMPGMDGYALIHALLDCGSCLPPLGCGSGGKANVCGG
jgi:CheY-like chemotaxis protein